LHKVVGIIAIFQRGKLLNRFFKFSRNSTWQLVQISRYVTLLMSGWRTKLKSADDYPLHKPIIVLSI